jgi:polysaccharide pyruvyl transferase WcaK-like protein
VSDRHRPDRVTAILIWGGWYGSRNIGDSAILLGLKALIARVNPDQPFYIRALSTDPDYTSTKGVTGEQALVKWEWYRPWAWLRVFRIFARADRVVVSGGTPIFDGSHAIRTLYLSLPLLLRKPFAIFGAGVKPLTSTFGRWTIPIFLRRAESVTVRDEDSYAILTRLGVPSVTLTGDSAFFAEPAPRPDVDALLEAFGISADESLLVVAPRLLSKERERLYLQEQMDDRLIHETPDTLAQAIDRIAPRFDRVVLMAMHFYGPDSDVPLIAEIVRRLRAANVTVIDRELRPEMAIAIFKRARMLLGMRLHALLLAASMGTPIVGLAYEEKVRGLFRRLRMDGYCLDLFSLEPDQVVTAAMKCLEREADVRAHLAGAVEDVRRLVLQSAERHLRIHPDGARPDAGSNA